MFAYERYLNLFHLSSFHADEIGDINWPYKTLLEYDEYDYVESNDANETSHEKGEDINIGFIDDKSLEDFVNDKEYKDIDTNEGTNGERANDKVLNYLENEDVNLLMKRTKKYMRKQRRKTRRHESKLI